MEPRIHADRAPDPRPADRRGPCRARGVPARGRDAGGRLTNDEGLLRTGERLWNNIVHKRMYITGGIGSTHVGEAFTYDYDLPNDTMYGESCASVGMCFVARQMLEHELRGEYADVLEKELFNGAIAGIALDGKHFLLRQSFGSRCSGDREQPRPPTCAARTRTMVRLRMLPVEYRPFDRLR